MFIYLYYKYGVVFVVKMLDNFTEDMYNISCLFKSCADIAQVVECILGKDEVTGSNPVISSKVLKTLCFQGFLFLLKKSERIITFDLLLFYATQRDK